MATILVVDDRPINREFLVMLLGYRGHRLLEAADGAEALALLRAEHPDLLIADILMPTMDGYELVRQLRADPAIAAIPVIFYTAHYHEQEARALAQACGVAHILTKPSEPELVLQTVDAALGLSVAPPLPTLADAFDREHLRLLTDKLSQQTTELRIANLQLTTLIEISLQLAEERDPQRLLESFCQHARELIGAQYAAVGVLSEDGQTLRHFFISGMNMATVARIGSPAPGPGVLGTLLAEQRATRLQNPGGDPSAVGFPPTYPPIHALLAAPIVSPAHVYGWIGLTNKIGAAEFSAADERLLAILAAQVGRIYENGRLYRAAQRYAAELEQEMAERKQAEEALEHNYSLLHAVIEGTPDAVYVKDQLGRYLMVNTAAARLLGLPAEQLIGKDDIALFDADTARPRIADDRRIMQHGQSETYEHTAISQGVRHSYLATTAPFRDQLGDVIGVLGISRDITEGKRLEAQFLQAQKMESIGQLAGGIAHDFNNMLSAVIGFIGTAQEQLPLDSPAQHDLEVAEGAAWRAAGLTRQLLTFARKQLVEPQVLNLNTVILDLDKLLRRLIGEDIELITLPAADLGQVKADPGHIEQVIVNLAVNARDAMPNGGQLIIETANTTLDADYAQQHVGVTPGAYVMLAISDSGSGMDQQVQQHLFEPFFTTKEVGKGTGLGLATCYGIIKQHGGNIWVYSEVGEGTTFKIYLPQADEAPEALLLRDAATAPQGSETVLLVEDEALVRELASSILQAQGYRVLVASNGEEALRVVEGSGSEVIELLVTDVVMPGMGGRALAEQVSRSKPGMKVLYISGYATDAITQQGRLDPGTNFLSKPFTRTALARKVREVLDS